MSDTKDDFRIQQQVWGEESQNGSGGRYKF